MICDGQLPLSTIVSHPNPLVCNNSEKQPTFISKHLLFKLHASQQLSMNLTFIRIIINKMLNPKLKLLFTEGTGHQMLTRLSV
jgi:hypothetical protein